MPNPAAEKQKNQGNAFFKQEDYKNAIACYQKAITLDPTFAAPHFNLFLIYKKQNQKTQAETALKDTLKKDPDHIKALYHLTQSLLETPTEAKEKTALTYLCLATLPNDPDATKKFKKEIDWLVTKRAELMRKIGAQLNFMCADLKLTTKGDVKILEFGAGMRSGFMGYNLHTEQDGMINLVTDYIDRILGLPCFLNSKQSVEVVDDRPFEKINLGEDWPKRGQFDPTDLSTFRGIYGGFSTQATRGDILTLNSGGNIADLLCDDKSFMQSLFDSLPKLTKFRPKSVRVPNSENKEELKSIATQLGTQYCVVKTAFGLGGKGVNILKTTNLSSEFNNQDLTSLLGGTLEKTLLACLPLTQRARVQRKLAEKLKQVSISEKDSPNHDGDEKIVEAYTASLPFNKNGQLYDATARAVFIVMRTNGKTTLIPLKAYWKLPSKPINASCTLEEKTKSSFPNQASTQEERIAKIKARSSLMSETHQTQIFDGLKACMPRLMEKAWVEDPDRLKEKQGKATFFFLIRTAFHFGEMGESWLAHKYVDQAHTLNPRHWRAPHVKGQIYLCQKQYEKAIACFKQAYAFGQESASLLQTAICYFHLGDEEKSAFYKKKALQQSMGMIKGKLTKTFMFLENKTTYIRTHLSHGRPYNPTPTNSTAFFSVGRGAGEGPAAAATTKDIEEASAYHVRHNKP